MITAATITLIIALTSVITAIIAVVFTFKSYKINKQRLIIQSLQIEKDTWINRIKHWIRNNLDNLEWPDKNFLKEDFVIRDKKEVSTWDDLAINKYYEIMDRAISKKFKGDETMTEMIEIVFVNRIKKSYWINKKII